MTLSMIMDDPAFVDTPKKVFPERMDTLRQRLTIKGKFSEAAENEKARCSFPQQAVISRNFSASAYAD